MDVPIFTSSLFEIKERFLIKPPPQGLPSPTHTDVLTRPAPGSSYLDPALLFFLLFFRPIHLLFILCSSSVHPLFILATRLFLANQRFGFIFPTRIYGVHHKKRPLPCLFSLFTKILSTPYSIFSQSSLFHPSSALFKKEDQLVSIKP